MSLHRWFLPHRDTHKKAHLISWEALLIYGLIYILLQASFQIFSNVKPGVLGTSSSITAQQIIELTNSERAKAGLPPVAENSALDQAARAKAANMFQENYWAHFAPSGKSPWDFILAAGYHFVYAGENLAKNFGNSSDVMTAWMNSPTHKENIVNPKYRDIGVAVEDGVINGQQTTLVVQEFGSTSPSYVAAAPVANVVTQPLSLPSLSPSTAPIMSPSPALVAASSPNVGGEVKVVPQEDYQQPLLNIPTTSETGNSINQPLFDPFQASKIYSISVISLITVLLLVDFIILKRRGVFRISSHHFAHMAILSVAATTIIISKPGQVDKGLQFRAPDPVTQIQQFKGP